MINQGKNITLSHEEKYICSEAYLRVIESRLKDFLEPDYNQGEDGYEIRSLYFDTPSDSLYEESIQGVEDRDKYRIRIYNESGSIIKLEKKTSIRNLKKKRTQLLEFENVNGLIQGKEEFDIFDCEKGTLLEEFVLKQKTALLKPKSIINYKRNAFVSDVGNVRITLDRNISVGSDVEDFFKEDIMLFPILPPNIHLLEVKYDGILPGYLVRLLNIDKLERTSFSKYVLGREVMKNNGRTSGLYEF